MSKLLDEVTIKCVLPHASRQVHAVPTLNGVVAKCVLLQAARQAHVV